ncbi:hypothetical protein BK133_30585 [Paenibacillus sp. FSL H8-0548]|uniref:hypothetical protein n=1 Tax=Paenibacillus sp. FSL H8-0548 TaxID=1920422 RepID=UPI00096CF51D|nr:hypothetical protein [Paenibacillus sp. FSL H8-0548]OMF16158.1 hypothetical protein BK133_30585 [Paenibacillus sp. FSL H8-0548]
MKLWDQMTENERNEIIAEKILGWVKKDNQWYKPSVSEDDQGPMTMLSFSTDDTCALMLLKQFDTYQVTKMFPTRYRTIINANKNFSIAPTFAESICRAALKVFDIES